MRAADECPARTPHSETGSTMGEEAPTEIMPGTFSDAERVVSDSSVSRLGMVFSMHRVCKCARVPSQAVAIGPMYKLKLCPREALCPQHETMQITSSAPLAAAKEWAREGVQWSCSVSQKLMSNLLINTSHSVDNGY